MNDLKMIILSAGRGTRLMSLTKKIPKALVKLRNGKTLLEIQLEEMIKSGVIDEYIIVVGYKAKQIEKKLRMYKEKIKIIYNPFIDFSNNLVSLWLAKSEMDTDFMVTNGDNIFTYDVYRKLVNKRGKKIFLTITNKVEYTEDDMKVQIDNKNNLCKVSKNIRTSKAFAESVGLVKITSKNNIKLFKDIMDDLIRNRWYINKYWLEIFNEAYRRGIKIEMFEIDRNKWQEIDCHLDLNKIIDGII